MHRQLSLTLATLQLLRGRSALANFAPVNLEDRAGSVDDLAAILADDPEHFLNSVDGTVTRHLGTE